MGIDSAPLHRLMVAEFPARANLKPGAANFASASAASRQYAKWARQRLSCRAHGQSHSVALPAILRREARSALRETLLSEATFANRAYAPRPRARRARRADSPSG